MNHLGTIELKTKRLLLRKYLKLKDGYHDLKVYSFINKVDN